MKRLPLLLLPLAACQQVGDNGANAAVEGEGAAVEAPAVSFMPGQWEIVTRVTAVEMPGMPPEALEAMIGQTTTISHCVTEEQARAAPGELLARSSEGQCQWVDLTMTGGTVEGTMRCDVEGGGSSTIEMSGDYRPESYTTESRMTVSSPGMETPMRMSGTSEGRRTGACTEASQ